MANSSVRPPESKSMSLDDAPNWTFISASSGEKLRFGPIFRPALNFSTLPSRFPKAFFRFADIPELELSQSNRVLSDAVISNPINPSLRNVIAPCPNNGIENKSKSSLKCI